MQRSLATGKPIDPGKLSPPEIGYARSRWPPKKRD
jgi:hypothetical protein